MRVSSYSLILIIKIRSYNIEIYSQVCKGADKTFIKRVGIGLKTCLRCVKETSQGDISFTHLKHMFVLYSY